jgi:geranylgeranyl diphosphate synthase type II
MNVHEQRYHSLRRSIDARLRSLANVESAKEANEACRYVLRAGGKRIRGVLTLLACEAVGGSVRDARSAAAAIEILHNFTLVHDDVMDNAASRRGKPTVQTRWNVNTAILSGDILLGLAYEQLLTSNSPKLRQMLDVFTDGFLTVSEGQALDLEFERRTNVSLQEYFAMIEKKTGRLISTALELGALAGGSTEDQRATLRRFGHYLGRAFQLQDDLLDVVAKEKEFGKTIGGDIIEGKKTFLLLTALARARGGDRRTLSRVLHRRNAPPLRSRRERDEEVRRVTAMYETTGALREATKRIATDTQRANDALAKLPASQSRDTLLWLSAMLLRRSS